MSGDKLLRCIGEVDEKLLTEAFQYVPHTLQRRKRRYYALGSIAACLIIALAVPAILAGPPEPTKGEPVSRVGSNTETVSGEPVETAGGEENEDVSVASGYGAGTNTKTENEETGEYGETQVASGMTETENDDGTTGLESPGGNDQGDVSGGEQEVKPELVAALGPEMGKMRSVSGFVPGFEDGRETAVEFSFNGAAYNFREKCDLAVELRCGEELGTLEVDGEGMLRTENRNLEGGQVFRSMLAETELIVKLNDEYAIFEREAEEESGN